MNGSETRPEQYMPYPELVEEEVRDSPYAIEDSVGNPTLGTTGMVDKVERRMAVPLNESGRHVAVHELGHILMSPDKPQRIRHDPRVLMAVEDARINQGLARLGLPVELPHSDLKRVETLAAQDLERGDLTTYVLRAIASIGTSAEEGILADVHHGPAEFHRLAGALVSTVRTRLDRSRRITKRPAATLAQARRVARDVARRLEEAGLLDRSSVRYTLRLVCDGRCSGHGTGEALRADPRRDGLLPRFLERTGRRKTVFPGRMKVTQAPLDVACDPARSGAGRRWRSATEGSVIRSIHRHLIDGAIFRRPVRRCGGTVLVDTSGSMHLGAGDVDRIIRGAPSATLVAIYSGRRNHGELRIVVRDGRRARPDSLKAFGRGNVIDVPALEWLARQPRPRVWISDGGVTGIGDAGSSTIRSRCSEICRRAGIRRAATVEDAARMLHGPSGRSPSAASWLPKEP